MYLPSFPALGRDLGVGPSAVESTVAIYFVGLALGQVFYGPLADRIGRKLPLYGGLVLYFLASLGCTQVTHINQLIALRFLQAIGGCAEMVIARAVVRDVFDERDSIRMFSFLMLVIGVAPVLAPLLGGAIVIHSGWRTIFYALAGFSALGLLSVTFLLPESHPLEKRERHSFKRILRVYWELLWHRSFMAYALSGSIFMAGLFAYVAGCSFVFMDLFGVTPERFGLYFGMNAIGLISASQINRFVTHHYDSRDVLSMALGVSAFSGMALFSTAWTGFGGFLGILIPLFVFISCFGFVLPITTALAMGPQGSRAGSASALLGMLQFLLGAIGSVLVGKLHDGTAVPMAGVMMVCGGSAWILYRVLQINRRTVGITEQSI
jgi:MFS transporter, DHA1 family, multidrug resistance protein